MAHWCVLTVSWQRQNQCVSCWESQPFLHSNTVVPWLLLLPLKILHNDLIWGFGKAQSEAKDSQHLFKDDVLRRGAAHTKLLFVRKHCHTWPIEEYCHLRIHISDLHGATLSWTNASRQQTRRSMETPDAIMSQTTRFVVSKHQDRNIFSQKQVTNRV